MSRDEIMQAVAEWFRIQPNDGGGYDIDDYDWQSGCYHNGIWVSLEQVVYLIEDISRERDW